MLDENDILNRKEKVKESEGRAVIYFLISNDEIVYIGKTSQNIESRIQAHLEKSEKIFDSYSVVDVMEQDLSDLESYYIFKFLPKYNKTISTENIKLKYLLQTQNMENQKLKLEGVILNNKLYIDLSEIKIQNEK